MTPEEMVSRLLYRDALMLVIDKPAGLAVHRGPNGGESLEDHFDALRFGLPRAPALAHRLDRDTSGCLVLGRHRQALARLGRLFKTGAIDKTYWAVVEGAPDAEEGVIDLPLGRRDATRGWWMKRDPNGQRAVTRWRVLGRAPVQQPGRSPPGGATLERVEERWEPVFRPDLRQHKSSERDDDSKISHPALTWLALAPLTGRTHQLRLHCAEMGWPIVGDSIYGAAPRRSGPPLHLLARDIVVPLYGNRAPIAVSAPAPKHMHERLAACGWRGEEDNPRRLRPGEFLPHAVGEGDRPKGGGGGL